MKLNNKLRNQINKAIGHLLTPNNKTKYFDEIPLTELFTILKDNQILPLQEDNTIWNGFLCGKEGNTTFMLGFITTYEPINNAMLNLSWYKMQSGRYEIVSYIS